MSEKTVADVHEILRFIQTSTWLESREFIQAHPEMLTDEAISILERLEQAAQENGEAQVAAVFSDHLALLGHTQEVGIEVAFALKIGSAVTELPTELATILNGLSQDVEHSPSMFRRFQLYQRTLKLVSPDQTSLLLATLQSQLLNNLSITVHKDQRENLEQAIAVYQQAIQFSPSNLPRFPTLLNNLGTALRDRYVSSGDLNDFEDAITVFQQAVQATPPDSPGQPSLLSNLGIGLRDSYAHSRDLAGLYAAMTAYQSALTILTREAMTIEWA